MRIGSVRAATTVKGEAWTLMTLFQFTDKVSGGYPIGDSKTGNLFGTASNGALWAATNTQLRIRSGVSEAISQRAPPPRRTLR